MVSLWRNHVNIHQTFLSTSRIMIIDDCSVHHVWKNQPTMRTIGNVRFVERNFDSRQMPLPVSDHPALRRDGDR